MYRPNNSMVQQGNYQNVNRFKTKRTFQMMNCQNPSFSNQQKTEFLFSKRSKYISNGNQNSFIFTEKKDNDIEMQDLQYKNKPQIPERIKKEIDKYQSDGYLIEKGYSYYHCKEDFMC